MLSRIHLPYGLMCHVSIICLFICSVVYSCVLCLSHLYCLYYGTLNVYSVTQDNKDSVLLL